MITSTFFACGKLTGSPRSFVNCTGINQSALCLLSHLPSQFPKSPPLWLRKPNDYSEEGAFGYVHLKTQKLLDFGVQRVIWIFTTSHKVVVAVPGQDWLTKDWNQDIESLDAKFFNIGAYLAEEGVESN